MNLLPKVLCVAAGLAAVGFLAPKCDAQKPVPASGKGDAKKVVNKAEKGKVAGGEESLVDPKLPVYTPRESGISGTLNAVGSDTLLNMMTAWAEVFAKLYPNVRPQVEGKGSGTAPPALIEGTAQLGPMSRKMKSKEIDGFEKKFGYKPTAIKVAIDALAVFVHKDNPLNKLTLQEIDAIFSKARKGGYKTDIKTWGDLGLKGAWASKPIRIYGRNSASGTYGYFKKKALFKGDYKDTVKEQPGSAAVVRAIGEDRYGIGYSGIGYKTAGVKTLALAKKKGDAYYSTATKNVESRKYPLARFLLVYINKKPKSAVRPLVSEFLRFALSKKGQEIVFKDGYLPLNATQAAKTLALLGSAQQ